VGTGPFKLREFARDSDVALDAFDGYVLGRPKLDTIEVRFITDGNTMMANILAGEVELYLGRGLSIEQGIQVRDQWSNGRLEPTGSSDVNLWPQLLNSDPQVIGDVNFRRALHYALDLREMANVLTVGLGNPVDSFVHSTDPEFNDVEDAIVRYPFDPARTTEMITGLGYTRGADGLLRDHAGATIPVEIRTLSADLNQKTTLSVVDYWRRAGVDASITTIAPQRQNDAEYRATFPGFQLLMGPSTPDRLLSSRAPLPANNFLATGNYPRYLNPEYDTLVNRYFATVPKDQRIPVLRDIVHVLTDQLPVLPLFQYLNPALISGRLLKVVPGSTYGAQEWDVR
ncbi:MAG TPA: ABC transporter substrate-binding protein, partial [Chloroflexota bacterium]